MNRIKDFLSNTLGTFGGILSFIFPLFVSVLPFVMIDCSWIVTLILFAIEYFFPITTIVFWIWGLISAINGPQNIITIIYYIAFIIAFLPFIISTILDIVDNFKRR